MPNNFRNAGWLWGVTAMAFCYILTLVAVNMLLKARESNLGGSYTDLARKSMGKTGQYVVDFTMVLMQFTFVVS